MGLEPLLSALAGRRCFIAWYPLPKNDGTGKVDKIPYNPQTRQNTDAHDPSTWFTAEDARHYIAHGVQVGIVISEGCGLFCVDLDAALLPSGEWSAFAQWALALFPGACVEVSHSGTGLHIFGTCATDFPEHRTANKKHWPMEVYTRRRFIALTGTHMAGSVLIDQTQALQQLIAHCLPDAVGARDAEWTTGSYAGWRGGGTDEQIINAQLNRAGAHAIFGHGASFRDLWEGNTAALCSAFPDPTGKNAWNGSAADQALANHLAWATGYDCERTLRLMWGSALKREKWERDDYLPRTIIRAIAGKIPAATGPDDDRTAEPITTPGPAAVVSTGPAAVPPAPDPTGAAVPPVPPAPGGGDAVAIPPAPAAAATVPPAPAHVQRRSLPAPGSYIAASEQPAFFDGCIYIEDMHGILMPDGSILAQKQFDVHFGGFEFQMRTDGSKPTNSAWECFVDSFMVRQPRAHGVCFNPSQDARAVTIRDGQTFINSWIPVHVPLQPGDPAPFLNHLKLLLPLGDDADILLAFMAAVMQYKGVKFQWAPFIQGVEGNGKTFFSEVLEYCVGARYAHWPRADMLGKQFNAAFYGKLLVCVEDVKISEARASLWETLKPMITGTRLEIEPKGVDSKISRDFCANFMLNSNHQNGLRKTKNDRRIAPLFCAQQHEADLIRCGLTEEYFKGLYRWAKGGGYAIIANFLNTYQIPQKWNPAGECVRAPITTSTTAALKAGMGSIEQEVAEAVAEGRPGFRDGWISSVAFDNLLGELGKTKQLPRNARQELLEGMGYKPHDGLPDGRVTAALPDGTRPRLFTLPNVGPQTRDVAAIAAAYLQAQAVPR